MAFTLKDILSDTKDIYKLSLLTEGVSLEGSISWVYLVEDPTIINHFWGRELAVTTGMAISEENSLENIIKLLIAHSSSGLIINTGKYINQISPEIISYCNKNNFPLLTCPWEIYLADMLKDFCFRTFEGEQEEKLISQAFIHAVEAPQKTENYYPVLQNVFNISKTFQVAAIYVDEPEKHDLMFTQKASFRMRSILEKLPYSYSFFLHEYYFLLIVNDVTKQEMNSIINQLTNTYDRIGPERATHIGIGSQVMGISKLYESYKRAKAAMRMAVFTHVQIVDFNSMGIYKLVFTSEDTEILSEYIDETLKPLTEYDLQHGSKYEETLFQYIKHNGSIIAISEEMFTHRNTISYRIGKIKELLGNNLETPEERFPYQLAFYLKNIIH